MIAPNLQDTTKQGISSSSQIKKLSLSSLKHKFKEWTIHTLLPKFCHLKFFWLTNVTSKCILTGNKAPRQVATPLSEGALPGLHRHLDCDGVHDQGHELCDDIVDVQFVELQANNQTFMLFHVLPQQNNLGQHRHYGGVPSAGLCGPCTPRCRYMWTLPWKQQPKPRKRTWYIKTTIMGNSASTFRDRDPLGIMECCKRATSRAEVTPWQRTRHAAPPAQTEGGESAGAPVCESVGKDPHYP